MNLSQALGGLSLNPVGGVAADQMLLDEVEAEVAVSEDQDLVAQLAGAGLVAPDTGNRDGHLSLNWDYLKMIISGYRGKLFC